MQEEREQSQKLRQRDQEEYDYKIVREREKKTNALNDEISRLEKELAQKEGLVSMLSVPMMVKEKA